MKISLEEQELTILVFLFLRSIKALEIGMGLLDITVPETIPLGKSSGKTDYANRLSQVVAKTTFPFLARSYLTVNLGVQKKIG